MRLTDYLIQEAQGSPGPHLSHQPEEQQLASVLRYADTILFIENPSITIQLAAIKQKPTLIKYLKNPAAEVQMLAVSKDGFTIKGIKDPSLEVIRAALQNPKTIRKQPQYDKLVKHIFKDNTMLMNKWLRYGETMRDQR
jgi:hypothetical protein